MQVNKVYRPQFILYMIQSLLLLQIIICFYHQAFVASIDNYLLSTNKLYISVNQTFHKKFTQLAYILDQLGFAGKKIGQILSAGGVHAIKQSVDVNTLSRASVEQKLYNGVRRVRRMEI